MPDASTPPTTPPGEPGLDDFWSWLDGDREQPEVSFHPRADPHPVGYALTGSGRRRTPNGTTRQAILKRQDGRCLYCEYPFGAQVRRGQRTIGLKLNWDHFVPYSYGQTNATGNWVAACHVCNGIKGPRVFDTVKQAQLYILDRWMTKDYELPSRLIRAVLTKRGA